MVTGEEETVEEAKGAEAKAKAKAVAVVMVTVEEAVEVAMAAAGTEAETESVPYREGTADAKVVSVVVVQQ